MKHISESALDRLRLEADLPDIDERYEIVRLIGSGGMGNVYLARDSKLDRGVALKVLGVPHPSKELVARLFREARIVACLEHPGIVPIHDVGTLPDGRPFFTMKYVQGKRLDQYARETASQRDTNNSQDLLRCFLKICEAMSFAHSHGVIHRDLKPQNIMIGPFGEVLVMDWGIGKIVLNASSDQDYAKDAFGREGFPRPSMPELQTLPTLDQTTRPRQNAESQDKDNSVRLTPELTPTGNDFATAAGTVLGTPMYMSPEQAHGQSDLVNQRSDVFALGAILRFLITGCGPLASRGSSATAAKPILISESATLRCKPLAAISRKAMSDNPDHRYADAGALADDVIAFLDGRPVAPYR